MPDYYGCSGWTEKRASYRECLRKQWTGDTKNRVRTPPQTLASLCSSPSALSSMTAGAVLFDDCDTPLSLCLYWCPSLSRVLLLSSISLFLWCSSSNEWWQTHPHRFPSIVTSTAISIIITVVVLVWQTTFRRFVAFSPRSSPCSSPALLVGFLVSTNEW